MNIKREGKTPSNEQELKDDEQEESATPYKVSNRM